MTTLTRQPKEVETARGDKPRAENNFENELVSGMRGRSSATTTHVRTQARFKPFCFNVITEEQRPFVHSSMTPYEQNVSRTFHWLTVHSHSAGFTSTSDGGISIE
jgi:hypothetical protein